MSDKKLRSSDDSDIEALGLVVSADRRRERRLRKRETAEGAAPGALWDFSSSGSSASAYVPVLCREIEAADEGGVAARSADTGGEEKEVGGVSVAGEATVLPVDFFALSILGQGEAEVEETPVTIFDDETGVDVVPTVPGADADDCLRPQKEKIRLVVVCTFGAVDISAF